MENREREELGQSGERASKEREEGRQQQPTKINEKTHLQIV